MKRYCPKCEYSRDHKQIILDGEMRFLCLFCYAKDPVSRLNIYRKTLKEMRLDVYHLLGHRGPYTRALIGAKLRMIERMFGQDAKDDLIEDLELNQLGFRSAKAHEP